jgi:hypothetical protein
MTPTPTTETQSSTTTAIQEGGAAAAAVENANGNLGAAATPEQTEVGAEGVQAAPTYTPNFKYKIKDAEFEFEDWAKTLVKEKTHEEKIRELYTKGHGIDEIKTSRDELKQKFEEIEPKYKTIEQSINMLGGYVRNGQMDKFFEALKIPEGLVLKYAADRLKFSQLPAEEQQRILNERATTQRLSETEEYSQTLEQQLEETRIAQRNLEIATALSRPDVQQVATQLETMVGKSGFFRDKVVEKGLLHFHTTGKDLTVQEAVQAVLQEVGPFLGVQQAGAGSAPANTQSQGPAVVVRQNQHIIPNIPTGGGSPVKKTPRSLDDLRAIRTQRAAVER